MNWQSFGLSMRAVNVLKNAGCNSISDIKQISDDDFKKLGNCGATTLQEIKDFAQQPTCLDVTKLSPGKRRALKAVYLFYVSGMTLVQIAEALPRTRQGKLLSRQHVFQIVQEGLYLLGFRTHVYVAPFGDVPIPEREAIVQRLVELCVDGDFS